jgi:HTH-type transcriptional regulator/antitoxin HigA
MNPPAPPVIPVPPGEKLDEELAAKGWSQADLADVLGRPVQAINEIVTGKKAITPETAVALSRAFGSPPQYWLELESKYRLDLLLFRASGRIADDVERKSRIYSKVPLKELKKLGWIDVDLADLDAT